MASDNQSDGGYDQEELTDEEDKALATDLLSDEKETAEHRMLVDLGRNDIGRILWNC